MWRTVAVWLPGSPLPGIPGGRAGRDLRPSSALLAWASSSSAAAARNFAYGAVHARALTIGLFLAG
jgi:hypothetical protein